MPRPKPNGAGRQPPTGSELALRMDIAIRARAIQDVVFERPQVTEQMAASLGISARTWRNNLMGKFAISGLTVMRLIATHHVSAAWLLAGTGAMFEGAVARSVRPSRVA